MYIHFVKAKDEKHESFMNNIGIKRKISKEDRLYEDDEELHSTLKDRGKKIEESYLIPAIKKKYKMDEIAAVVETPLDTDCHLSCCSFQIVKSLSKEEGECNDNDGEEKNEVVEEEEEVERKGNVEEEEEEGDEQVHNFEAYCSMCDLSVLIQDNFSWRTHLSSTLHLFNRKFTPKSTSIVELEESNPGYKLVVKQGT